MKLKVESIPNFPENCNPYHYDSYHMGRDIGENLVMLHDNHASEPMRYFILVNTKTGERSKVTIESEDSK